MRNLKTIENRVLAVLKEHPEARNDDMKLYLLVSKACIYDTHGISHFSFEDVMSNYKAYGIPCFESIRRTRQKIQAKYPELGCSPKYAGQGTKCSVSIPTTLKAKMGGKKKMAAKKSANTALQQKVKVLAKLYDSGCKTEKDLKALSLQSILKIPDISVSDMTVITELQEQIAKNRLFSYLGGADDEQESKQNE